MYSHQILNDPLPGEHVFTSKKRTNAIECAAVAKLGHDEYKAELDQPAETYVANRRIRSHLPQLYGIDVWSRTLSHYHITI